jgi:hypothetical protein
VAGATRLRWQAVRAIDAELAKDLAAVVLGERGSLATAGIAAAWPVGRPAANCGYRADPVKMRVATSKPVPAANWKPYASDRRTERPPAVLLSAQLRSLADGGGIPVEIGYQGRRYRVRGVAISLMSRRQTSSPEKALP